MEHRIIVAIIRRNKLEEVEKRLREIGIARIVVSKVKGYGEYCDFFARDWMVDEVRLEIFTGKDRVDSITTAIMDAAHTGLLGDGIIAVIPIERFFRIRTRSEATPNEFLSKGAQCHDSNIVHEGS
jgi:nitrogen regulatory protein P-II 1